MTIAVRLPLSRTTRRLAAIGALLSVAMSVAPGQAGPATPTTVRVSVSSAGEEASGSTSVISADGRYVAFVSGAPNLVPGDTNGSGDVFVRDRTAGTTTRVSVSSTGAQTACCFINGTPTISANGRYVAFTSAAPNLVPGDTNVTTDVFVRDRTAGTTRRVSVSNTGAQTTDTSETKPSAVTDDGRYIAFRSYDRNLVTNDHHGGPDIFLRDMVAGTTILLSVASGGASASYLSQADYPSISADGRLVFFHSDATNLVPGDTNAKSDVFVRNWQAGTTRRISLSSTGAQADGGSGGAEISADGRYVAFVSLATNLVPGDTNNLVDVFLRDRQAGTTRRISIPSGGGLANRDSSSPSISPDGRYVTFMTDASNVVAGDTNGSHDVFLRDWQGRTTRRVSLSSTGGQGDSSSLYGSVSSGGLFVAFDSYATNLVAGDTNNTLDVFVRVR